MDPTTRSFCRHCYSWSGVSYFTYWSYWFFRSYFHQQEKKGRVYCWLLTVLVESPGGGGIPRKLRWEFADRFPKFKTKICDYSFSIYDLTKKCNILFKTWPLLNTLTQTCVTISFLVQTDVKALWRTFVDGLIDNDESVGSPNERAYPRAHPGLLQDECKKQNPSDQTIRNLW